MKKITVSLLLALAAGRCFAQVDYCTELNKAIAGIENNFANYTTFAFTSTSGAKAYSTDISFTPDNKANVFRGPAADEVFFQQVLDKDTARYMELYRKVERCLVSDKNYWTKLDAVSGKSVVFSCGKNGAEIFLIKASYGVVMKMMRDEKKNIPVFTPQFCAGLTALLKDAETNFSATMGKYVDSSILGKRYEGRTKLNQRGVSSTIYVSKSFFKAGQLEYQYGEMVSGAEMPPAEVLAYFDKCLSSLKGWQKDDSQGVEEVKYSKGNVVLTLRTSKAYNAKEADNTHLTIRKTE